MLIVFFDIWGIVMAEWVPSGQTVNQQYYIEVLMKLCERMRRKRPELCRNGCILHQDNAPAHNALSVKQFLANKNITVLEHPPYSPDLTPCDFYLFPKIKSVLKGTHFVSAEDVKAKTTDTSTALQNMTCGTALNIGSIVCSCVSTQKGNISKAIVVHFLNLLNSKSYRHTLTFFLTSYTTILQKKNNVYSLYNNIVYTTPI